MKIKNVLTASAIIGAIGFSSCNKYEDGPAFSLRAKKERVANTWKVQKATNNGEEVTDQYDEYTLRTTRDGDAELAALYTLGNFSYEFETDGTWAFESDQTVLNLDFENDDADRSYQILKLEEDEMWLREVGKEDEIQLITK
jgi:hypothetical protein